MIIHGVSAMNKPVVSLSFILLLTGIPPAQAAEEISPQHLRRIETLQRRADMMAFGEPGSNNYHLAKARCWLDFALSEYYVMDNSGIVTAATEQAGALLDALEKKQADIPQDTPRILESSEAVRPDLWDKIAALKSHAGFSCGQRQIAGAEVHLVWTGHEKAEYGWSHAESYARTAENLVYEAQVAIDNCAEEIPAPVVPEPHIIERITQSSDALFGFGKATLNPLALWRLDKLLDSIKRLATLEDVALVGHTDHLSKNGRQEINLRLSRKRAESIRQYLIESGIPADKIHASGVGATQPLTKCSTRQGKAKLIACLQPNRRVEIILRGVK